MANTKLDLIKNWDRIIRWRDIYIDSDPNNSVYIKGSAYGRIKDFISRRENGSLILSGDRGAGKTTTVMTVLKDLKNQVFPIYINALHIESLQNNQDNSFLDTLQIIKELISQLAREIKTRGIKKNDDLEKLLMIINATEFIKKEYINDEGVASIKGTTSFGAQSSLIASKIALSAELKNTFNNEEIFIKAGYSIEDYSSELSKIIETLELPQTGKGVIDISKKLSNFLQVHLTIKKLTKSERKPKIIFIFDELDYYDDEGTGAKAGPNQVLEAIKKLKNLFTLSNAHFIFITGKKTYKKATDFNSNYHTLFSEKVFVAKPNGEELKEYLEIVLNIKNIKMTPKVEKFIWYLIEASRHNHFQLIQAIKSRIDYSTNNKIPSLPIIMSENEEKIALVHIALNSIYKHFMQIGLFEHHSELLFDELVNVKDNFDTWIHGEGLHPISLSSSNLGGIKPELVNYIKNAKRSFIRYLFKLSDTNIPDELKNYSLLEITPPWDKLNVTIDLSSVKRGIQVPITDTELSVVSLSKEIIGSVNTYLSALQFDTVDNIKEAIGELANRFGLSVDAGIIDSIQKASAQIKNNLFFERDPNLTQNANEHLNTVKQTIDSRLRLFGNNVIRVDSGDCLLEKGGLVLKNNSNVTIFENIQTNKKKKIEIDYKATILENDGLLNFIAYTNTATPPGDRYFMFRTDTRKPDSNRGNGILLKNDGAESWSYIDDIGEERKSSTVNKQVNCKIAIDQYETKFDILRGYTKTENIASLKMDIKPISFGFKLEQGSATIKNLKFK